jgi:hypothetical protein
MDHPLMRATAARPNRFQYVFLYRQKRRSVTAISFDAGESYRETARVYIQLPFSSRGGD